MAVRARNVGMDVASAGIVRPGQVGPDAEAVASALAGIDAGEAPAEARIAIAFGPEDGAIGSDAVYNAHTEALQQGFQQLFLFGFAL